MNIKEDPKLKMLIIKKNLSPTRRRMYKYNLKIMHQLTGLTPSQLIEEAKKEQMPYIDPQTQQIVFKDVEDRKITEYIYRFYEHINKENAKPATIQTRMSVIRSFYNMYKIQLPDKINITIPRKIIRKGDIPCLEDVKMGVEQARHLKYKAIILLVATSGIRSGDIRRFKIGDFLEASKEYHNGTIEGLLQSKESIVPTWDFIPRKTRSNHNICVTFNTPEASAYIIEYLKQRQLKGEILTEDSYLFVSTRGKYYSMKGFLWVFESVNQELFGKDKLDMQFFRAHNLRKFFLSTFRQITNDLFSLKIIAGHSIANNNDENYQEIPVKELKRLYMKVIPYLSIKDTRVHTIKSKEFREVEKLLNAKDQEITRMNEELKLIRDLLSDRGLREELDKRH